MTAIHLTLVAPYLCGSPGLALCLVVALLALRCRC